jgi:1-acyl-sn-glycerol-3-phosphate acyltransferase
VVVFPEGTRGGSGTEKRTQSGIGFLAVKGNVPVIPVHIGGSDKVLPPGAKFPKRGSVTVTFGKPIQFTKDRSYEDIVSAIMGEITGLSCRA